MRATGHVTRQTENGDVDTESPVSVEVREDDGVLTLGADQMRDGIADAIPRRANRATDVGVSARGRPRASPARDRGSISRPGAK